MARPRTTTRLPQTGAVDPPPVGPDPIEPPIEPAIERGAGEPGGCMKPARYGIADECSIARSERRYPPRLPDQERRAGNERRLAACHCALFPPRGAEPHEALP